MNSNQPMTRRDVVALFAYTILLAGALERVLFWAGLAILPRLPIFGSSTRVSNDFLPALATVVLCVLLVPFVPLVASGAAGRAGNEPLTKLGVRALLLPCIGLAVFALGLLQLVTFGCYWWSFHSSSSSFRSSVEPMYRVYLAASSIQMSIGFALAFLPAIFDSMRHRIRNEDDGI